MKKNPFKKQGIMDTLTNVGIGGAANVAMDYLVDSVDSLKTMDSTTINAIKIGVGVLGGTMTTNKMIRAAVDGIAVVGVSNLVQGLLEDTGSEKGSGSGTESGSGSDKSGMGGLPYGTIGRLRMGNRYFRNASPKRVAGVAGGIMGK